MMKTVLTGKTFDRLTVIAEGPRHITSAGNPVRTWLCRCVCGAEVSRLAGAFAPRRRWPLSCGCSGREKTVQRNFVHGFSAGKRSPEYIAWKALRRRCNSPSSPDYHYYGQRGISVCARWNDFANFLSDMGARPSDKHSIDRIDVDGNYSPENCRWATPVEQRRNQRRYIEAHQ